RPDVDLAARQERHRAVEVDREAALDLVEDDALDLLVALERLLELAPALLAARLVARQHGLAERVLDPFEIDLDGVADLELALAARSGEFADRDPALGLQADVDDGHVFFDGDDGALDRGPFVQIALGERLFQQRGEIFARRLGGGDSHVLSCCGAPTVEVTGVPNGWGRRSRRPPTTAGSPAGRRLGPAVGTMIDVRRRRTVL